MYTIYENSIFWDGWQVADINPNIPKDIRAQVEEDLTSMEKRIDNVREKLNGLSESVNELIEHFDSEF